MKKLLLYITLITLTGLPFTCVSDTKADGSLYVCECECICSECDITSSCHAAVWGGCIEYLSCFSVCIRKCNESCGSYVFSINKGCRLSDGACIATYLLGNDDPRLDTIRQFRDNVLAQTPKGQEIIKLYYQWSSAIVQAMEGDEEFKEWVTEQVEGVLPLVEGALE